MRINAPKVFNDTVSMVKDFYFPKYVNIAKSYSDDNVSDALLKLELSQDIFESYAKKKGVFVSIDRGDSVHITEHKDNKNLRKVFDRSVIIKVSDGITGKEKMATVDTTKDNFQYSNVKFISGKDKQGNKVVMKSTENHEDNFLRSVYRTVSYLAELVQKK